MWKRLSVFCVILVLALSSLGAWPTWLTGEPESEGQLKLELKEKEAVILSQQEYIGQLETLLTESQEESKLLNEIQQNLEKELSKWKSNYQTLENSLVRAKSEVDALKKLSEISETDSLVKQEEIADLSDTVVTVQEENVELYTKKKPDWGGLVGGGATWDPTSGNFGATMDMGVRYKNWALVTGVEWKPSEWKLEIPQFSDLSFSTGVQWQF